MVILKANNSALLNGVKSSYLTANYASGVTSLVVTNGSGFQIGDSLLLGEFGSETSEIVQVSAVSTNTLTVATTLFAHPESTKVYILPYNQVKFYWTSTATYATTTLLATSNIQADALYTVYNDGSNSTGFGWFVYYKSLSLGGSTTQFDITNTSGTTYRYTYDTTGTDPNIINRVYVGSSVVTNGQNFNVANNGTFTVTAVGTNYFEVTNASGVAENNVTLGTGTLTVNITSSNSNAIPYADFAENSVKKILDSFYSMLNNKERSLISDTDALRWLNEGYARAKNELNLVNNEYSVASQATITTVSGTTEYDLETDLSITDFGDVVSITDTQGVKIDNIPISEVLGYRYDTYAISLTKYYLRGTKIGFVPTPTAADVYYMYYKSKSSVLSSMYSTVDFPDNNFYFLLDYMMYRACPKLGRSQNETQVYITAYTAGVSLMKVTSVKQSDHLDSWEPAAETNV